MPASPPVEAVIAEKPKPASIPNGVKFAFGGLAGYVFYIDYGLRVI